MIVDLNVVDRDPFDEKIFDYCICGAGVAGITLALKLAKKFRVVVLEGGGAEFSKESQDIYKGENVGRPYFNLASTRLRYLGGTSNHWAGWCLPMEDYDFRKKPHVEYSGWPIGSRDLAPYLYEAESILDVTSGTTALQSAGSDDFANSISAADDFRRIESKLSAPTRFGKKYRRQLEKTPGLACFLNANLVDLKLIENGTQLEKAEVKNFSGGSFDVYARKFILAAGGIENPRILLNCNRQMAAGIGNEKDLVGRFFCDHPAHMVGQFMLEDAPRGYLAKNWFPTEHLNFRYISPSVEFMEREQVLNSQILFETFEPKLNETGFKERLERTVCEWDWMRETPLCPSDGRLHMVMEPMLDPESRISLGTEVDRFGNRRIHLNWKLSEIDKRTMQAPVVRLGEVFAAKGIGRVQVPDWLLSDDLNFPTADQVAGHHHMCTTRMSDSPGEGVVDSNQKVFGMDNLYIAGSSVFSTPGRDSPTITIVQMTLRLADHLSGLEY
jgi:choline dehydrogenase-like flavoprotein